jgi:hypothetical protein
MLKPVWVLCDGGLARRVGVMPALHGSRAAPPPGGAACLAMRLGGSSLPMGVLGVSATGGLPPAVEWWAGALSHGGLILWPNSEAGLKKMEGGSARSTGPHQYVHA